MINPINLLNMNPTNWKNAKGNHVIGINNHKYGIVNLVMKREAELRGE